MLLLLLVSIIYLFVCCYIVSNLCYCYTLHQVIIYYSGQILYMMCSLSCLNHSIVLSINNYYYYYFVCKQLVYKLQPHKLAKLLKSCSPAIATKGLQMKPFICICIQGITGAKHFT